jgi:pimeloyl-ACP methyl ester carboxylesterase
MHGSRSLPRAMLLLTSVCVGFALAPHTPSTPEVAMTTVHAQGRQDSTPSVAGAQALRMPAQVAGEGPALVLIGGGLTGWKSWEPHVERLAATRTVARLQLLGVQHGLDDRALPDGYSVPMESEALAAALDALGWHEPLDLVAWSYGALITLDFALNHPARVRTLTLIEPPAAWMLPDQGQDDPDVQAVRSLTRSLGDEVTAADLERFVCTIGLCPPGIVPSELPQWPVWMEHRRSLRIGTSPFDHTDDRARLRGFDRPVLLVTGTGTAPFLRRIHDLLAVHLPQARTTEMPAGHAPQIVSMDRFLAELARFHERAGRRTPRPSHDGGDERPAR